MRNVQVIEGHPGGEHAPIAVAVTRFNSFVTEALLDGALDTLRRHGIEEAEVTVVRVPGSYELPLVADRLAAGGHYAGIIALGCVIRGETAHFDYVAGECSAGLSAVMRARSLPVGFGVVTAESTEQALERAGIKGGNKGAEAARATLETLNLLGKL